MQISDILLFLHQEGIPFTFRGNENETVEGFSSLAHYKSGSMTWVKKAENLPQGADLSQIRLAIVSEDVEGNFANTITSPLSRRAFFSTLEHFYTPAECAPAIGENTYLSPQVKLGKNVRIGHNCSLDGQITIGDNAVIGSNVTIVNRLIIGEGTEIRSGVVIGHDDSISYTEDAHHNKLPIRHFGGVWIGRNVMIGENSTVCRGTLDDTYIGDGVRLDALTQVSHNCRFEKNSVAVGGCRFFGSVTVEEGAYLVGALVRNQCRIGKEAVVGMGAVVIKNVENNQTVVGNPAKPFVKKEG